MTSEPKFERLNLERLAFEFGFHFVDGRWTDGERSYASLEELYEHEAEEVPEEELEDLSEDDIEDDGLWEESERLRKGDEHHGKN